MRDTNKMLRDMAKAQVALYDARYAWGIDEQWDINIVFLDKDKEEGSPTDIGIEILHWPSKRATIEISPDYDISNIKQDMLHELGHLVIAPLWRLLTDYIDNIPEFREGTILRKIVEENWNSTENIVIDSIVFQVLLRRD